MSLTRVKLQSFTAFDHLDLELSPGINVFVGANGTGKTHLMKVCYAACDVSQTGDFFADKLIRVFLPSRRSLGRLVKRQGRSARGSATVYYGDMSLRISFSSHAKTARSARVTGAGKWESLDIESVFVPVKEMLANAPGFRSLYARREIHFEEVYSDIIDRAYRPLLRGRMDDTRRSLLNTLQKHIDGKIRVQNEEFFLRKRNRNLEFNLLSEGMRKLGLLWLLIQNGTLLTNSVLFWDEPETNLSPKMFGVLIDVLLELQRDGVQVFLATHDYVILKELDLQSESGDQVAFHSFHQDKEGEISCNTTSNYLGMHPNAIADTFDHLYEREVDRSLRDIAR